MRMVILGANGQVGAEVSLLLARSPELKVRAVSRTRGGSAFLRYSGLPVLHGDIADPARAAAMMEGANVVASFALAIGTPAVSIAKNAEIIERIFRHAPPDAVIVFFSTIAVYDRKDGSGVFRSPYEQSKLKTEKLALKLAAAANRTLYILRLGHVAGDLQGINSIWLGEIKSGTVRLPDPERASNVTHTAAIAEALLAIAQGRAGPPGLYDLVNSPQWTWREIYEHEASKLGAPFVFESAGAAGRPGLAARTLGRLRQTAVALRGVAAQPKVRQILERGLALLPVAFNEAAKAKYSVNRMRGEIAALNPPSEITNTAALWAGLPVKLLPGVRPTREALALPEFQLGDPVGPRWPADLP